MFDIRPETIALGWTNGYPFYCGKTIKSTKVRLTGHRNQAPKQPRRPVSAWTIACDDHIRIQTMQIVPLGDDWIAAECFWIKTLRRLYPICANVNEGGAGMPGYVQTAEARERTRQTHTGAKRSPETCARIARAVIEWHAANTTQGLLSETPSNKRKRDRYRSAKMRETYSTSKLSRPEQAAIREENVRVRATAVNN
jgi:hypothetical protein